MENNNEKPVKEESKIVNLCEDMNPHSHNEESYQKMLKDQKVQQQVKQIKK